MAFDTVQSDPDVCPNCFRRTHDRFERNYAVDMHRGELWFREVDMSDALYRDENSTSRISESGGSRGMKTICECGMRPFAWDWIEDNCEQDPETGKYDIPEWKERPLQKWKFFEYAEHLLERFQENGVTLDTNVWWAELDRLKSDPDEQFADDRIFEKATDRAITSANVRSEISVRS